MAKTLACIVTDPVGLYATPAMDLIEVAKTFDSDFTLTYSGKTVNLKSMMGVLSLGIPTKAKIVITADGDDEETGIEAVHEKMKELGIIGKRMHDAFFFFFMYNRRKELMV